MGTGFITKDKKAQKYYAQIPGNCVKYNSYLILDFFTRAVNATKIPISPPVHL